ncbi:MAG TPA: 50S ribosomal protein L29 [Candidatus Moranbacteria bacterium]|nr:50S ribosomal protein L29 [Candidatus Moranbacteria bacterium]HRY28394.1 50S ribosomal protein L29 [Candidatus Moranbacteria bacterium]HSA08321.1 50S ribosomal protein L29 [Candidatus Moranbacteria bacterium]
MKTQEFRNMNIEQLKKLVQEKRTQAVKLKFDVATKQAKNHRQYRDIKKDIAKALTLIKESEK